MNPKPNAHVCAYGQISSSDARESLCALPGRPPSGPLPPFHMGPRPETHSILRLPSSRPLPSTISTQFFTGSSSGLEKSIITLTGLRIRAWSISCRERGWE